MAPSKRHLAIRPSALRPAVKAGQRITHWRPVNSRPSTLPLPLFDALRQQAALSSLADPASVGAALRKFHIFCDSFGVEEEERLPTTFPILHSFALWAASSSDSLDGAFASNPFEPVAKRTVDGYLSGIRAWHLAHGFPPPLSVEQQTIVRFSLRGLARREGNSRRRAPRPPITLEQLEGLGKKLNLQDGFDAAVWAVALSAFFGLARLGELTVSSRKAYSPFLHTSATDLRFGEDDKGNPFALIHLPTTKTAPLGSGGQNLVLALQPTSVNPLAALQHTTIVNRLSQADQHLFAWRDKQGVARPLTRSAFLKRLGSAWQAEWGGKVFGHSFRIGGASFFLAKGCETKDVQLLGRWKSDAFHVYVRAFEMIAPQRFAMRAAQ